MRAVPLGAGMACVSARRARASRARDQREGAAVQGSAPGGNCPRCSEMPLSFISISKCCSVCPQPDPSVLPLGTYPVRRATPTLRLALSDTHWLHFSPRINSSCWAKLDCWNLAARQAISPNLGRSALQTAFSVKLYPCTPNPHCIRTTILCHAIHSWARCSRG